MNPTENEEEKAPRQRQAARRSAEQIEAIIGDYRASGLKVREYARRTGISAVSLYGWLRRGQSMAERRGRTEGFAAVVLAGGVQTGGLVTLRTAMGWQVEVSGQEAGYVAALIKELLPCLR